MPIGGRLTSLGDFDCLLLLGINIVGVAALWEAEHEQAAAAVMALILLSHGSGIVMLLVERYSHINNPSGLSQQLSFSKDKTFE